MVGSSLMRRTRFQSTLSVRRATQHLQLGSERGKISIHALRKESDPARKESSRPLRFQSTLSVRRATCPYTAHVVHDDEFQSTLSVRRATCPFVCVILPEFISIHALRKESDPR